MRPSLSGSAPSRKRRFNDLDDVESHHNVCGSEPKLKRQGLSTNCRMMNNNSNNVNTQLIPKQTKPKRQNSKTKQEWEANRCVITHDFSTFALTIGNEQLMLEQYNKLELTKSRTYDIWLTISLNKHKIVDINLYSSSIKLESKLRLFLRGDKRDSNLNIRDKTKQSAVRRRQNENAFIHIDGKNLDEFFDFIMYLHINKQGKEEIPNSYKVLSFDERKSSSYRKSKRNKNMNGYTPNTRKTRGKTQQTLTQMEQEINPLKSNKKIIKTEYPKERNQYRNNRRYIADIKQRYELQIDKLRKEKTEYIQKYNKSNAQNAQLMEQCKQMKLEMNEIKQELSKLKRMKNTDTAKYIEWNSDEFVDWIITLEQERFAKYEDTFRDIFNEEDVKGEAIPFIDKYEWKNWGITSFMDRTILDKHIKNLVNTNNNKQQNQNNN